MDFPFSAKCEKVIKCRRCKKKMPVKDAIRIDNEYYCKDCAKAEKDWRFLEMMDSIK